MSGSTGAVIGGRIAGISSFSVDGSNFQVTEASYSESSVKREVLIGLNGIHGYQELPVAGFIAVTLRDSAGITLADFNAMTNVTATLELASGKTVVATGCVTTDVQEVENMTEMTFKVKFESASVASF